MQWLYEYKKLTVLDGSKDHKESDKDENETKIAFPITTMPIIKKIAHKTLQPSVLAVAEKPAPSQSTYKRIEAGKSSFGRKRKLFRNALLMDTLMHRKD